MRTIYRIMKEEQEKSGLVDIPWMVERMSTSIGSHILNLENLDRMEETPKKAFYDCGELVNFRTHINVMAPSGFGKSTVMRFILSPHRGLLKEVGAFNTSVRSTFSPESWMGTTLTKNGDVQNKPGIFSRYKRGILGADEFMRFVGMMNTHNSDEYSNEEVYLLTALEHDSATKDLSSGPIEEYGIGTTLWAGSRITSIDMRHGLARRVLFQIFIPTPSICRKFRESMRDDKRKNMITTRVQDEMNNSVVRVIQDLESVRELDYNELYGYLEKYPHIPHFEVNLLKRIAAGFSAARNTLPDIVMDDWLKGLLEDEMNSRRIIRGNPEHEIILRILREEGEMSRGELFKFLRNWYQFTDSHIQSIMNGMRNSLSKRRDDGINDYVYFIKGTGAGSRLRGNRNSKPSGMTSKFRTKSNFKKGGN